MNKTQILIWTVVLLVILNLTTIGTVIYHNYNEKTDSQSIVLDTGGNILLSGRYFRQNMGFNDSQMNVFREANREFRPKANQIIFKIDSLKNEIFTELKKQHTDTIRLNRLSHETGIQHENLKRETNRFYLKIKAVCTLTQLQQLQNTFIPLFRDTPCNGNGMNRQGRGRGQGQGFQNQQLNK